MELETLSPESFRNLAPHPSELHPRLNLVVGANGEGKTNFVEAIALVAGQPSFRTADLRVLPAEGHAKATVAARGGGGLLAVSVENGVRRHFWNGERTARLEARRRLPAVFLTTSDLTRFTGPPTERRRALDRAAFALDPAHARHLAAYEKARAARAKILAAPKPDTELLAVYGETMAPEGGMVAAGRREALAALGPALRAEARRLGSPWAETELTLKSDLPAGGDAKLLAAALAAALRDRERDERRAGRCLVGPHLDDVLAHAAGVVVGDRASAGENRTLVLAWTLAERAVLGKGVGTSPLLLFDDFDSEWDREVLATFSEALGDDGQVVLTSARPEALRALPLPSGWLFRMERGRLHRDGILGAGRGWAAQRAAAG